MWFNTVRATQCILQGGGAETETQISLLCWDGGIVFRLLTWEAFCVWTKPNTFWNLITSRSFTLTCCVHRVRSYKAPSSPSTTRCRHSWILLTWDKPPKRWPLLLGAAFDSLSNTISCSVRQCPPFQEIPSITICGKLIIAFVKNGLIYMKLLKLIKLRMFLSFSCSPHKVARPRISAGNNTYAIIKVDDDRIFPTKK